MRARHADLQGVLIHQIDEHRLAPRDMLRERDRGVIARLHDHALDEILDADLRADFHEHARAVLIPGVRADAHLVVELDAAVLQRMEHGVCGHQLREARGFKPLILVGGRQHLAADVVHQEVAARLDLRRRRNWRRLEARRRRRLRHAERRRDAAGRGGDGAIGAGCEQRCECEDDEG